MLWNLFSIKIGKLDKRTKFYLNRKTKKEYIIKGKEGNFVKVKENFTPYIVVLDKEISVYCKLKDLPKETRKKKKKKVYFGALILIILLIIIFSSLYF